MYIIDGLPRELTFVFCTCLEGNSPRFGLAIRELPFDLIFKLTWGSLLKLA